MEQKDEAMIYACFAMLGRMMSGNYIPMEAIAKQAWAQAQAMIDNKPEELK